MVKIDTGALCDGIWKTKDLADLFGISVSTFKRREEQYLGLLKEYCTVEVFGRGQWLMKLHEGRVK